MTIYVDTSAWIALHEPKDKNHPAAKRALAGLVGANEVMATGRHTLVELADGLARHYDQEAASRELQRILASPRVRVEPSEPHWEDALALLRERAAWGVDLSDCLSFALMRRKGMSRAFTYDRDFAKAGFEVVGGAGLK